jgi:hypothetical protein
MPVPTTADYREFINALLDAKPGVFDGHQNTVFDHESGTLKK